MKRRGPQQTARSYNRWLFGVLLLALIPLFINIGVDPLWYFGGNQFGPNYPFNERVSKSNQLSGNEDQYDCLILGSSKTTLLDVRDITGRRCFNYAVSQARFSDALDLAKYSKVRGMKPKTIIFALDGFNFSEALSNFRNPMPPFITVGGPPPNLVSTYLSIDASEFSYRTLQHQAPNDRYYDSEFAARALPGAGPFQPERPLKVPELVPRDQGFNQFSLGPFATDKDLHSLREMFPDALLLAYAPPVTAQWTAKLHLAGTLQSYLDAIYASRAMFDRVYDFSVPSKITKNPENTYDGSHFYRDVNRVVAQALSNPPKPSEAALEVHELAKSDYEKRFEDAVLAYVQEVGVEARSVRAP